MEPFTNPEPMTRAELDMVRRSVGMEAVILRLGDADLSRGKAKTPKGRCFWLKDGRRVSFDAIAGGGHISSLSKQPDPNAPATGTYKV